MGFHGIWVTLLWHYYLSKHLLKGKDSVLSCISDGFMQGELLPISVLNIILLTCHTWLLPIILRTKDISSEYIVPEFF